jgi:predicted MPP superfamily phosphohydrolase
VAPTFVVRGNWDVWYWSGLDLYGGTGASELDGAPITMQVAGTRLVLTGVPVDGEGRIRAGLAAVPADVFTVFAYHSPDQIKSVGRADLYCAGHTHGGQVALPFYGAIVTLSRYGKRYEAGLYRHGNTWMYVNRGIGMEGGPTSPRVRFCARPELTMIELARE